MKTLFALTLLLSTAFAADAPKLSDEAKARLLSDYKSVLLAQNAVKDRVNKFNADYQKELAGLPKGSTIAVDPDKDEVTVTLPAPEVKPEVKK